MGYAVRWKMKLLGYIGILITPVFLWLGFQSDKFVRTGKFVVYLLYSVIFLFTVFIAYEFSKRHGKLERAMWLRLMGKPYRIPYFNKSLGFPAACLTALTG